MRLADNWPLLTMAPSRSAAAVALMAFCLALSQTPAAAATVFDASQVVSTYNQGGVYGQEVNFIVGVDFGWGVYAYVPEIYYYNLDGLVPPAYTDCNCDQQQSGNPLAGYWTFDHYFTSETDVTVQYAMFRPFAFTNSCNACMNCQNAQQQGIQYEYWDSLCDWIDVYTLGN